MKLIWGENKAGLVIQKSMKYSSISCQVFNCEVATFINLASVLLNFRKFKKHDDYWGENLEIKKEWKATEIFFAVFVHRSFPLKNDLFEYFCNDSRAQVIVKEPH